MILTLSIVVLSDENRVVHCSCFLGQVKKNTNSVMLFSYLTRMCLSQIFIMNTFEDTWFSLDRKDMKACNLKK